MTLPHLLRARLALSDEEKKKLAVAYATARFDKFKAENLSPRSRKEMTIRAFRAGMAHDEKRLQPLLEQMIACVEAVGDYCYEASGDAVEEEKKKRCRAVLAALSALVEE